MCRYAGRLRTTYRSAHLVLCPPSAKGQSPAATTAALPLELPPVWCAGLCGLRAVPVTRLSPVVPRPVSHGVQKVGGMGGAPCSAASNQPRRLTQRRLVTAVPDAAPPGLADHPPISCSVVLPSSRAPASCSACTPARLRTGVRLRRREGREVSRVTLRGAAHHECAHAEGCMCMRMCMGRQPAAGEWRGRALTNQTSFSHQGPPALTSLP